MRVLLVGNPNAGKSTLYNVLTGEHQHVGNWPGVTVEQKKGYFDVGDKRIEVIDLPGIYSLSCANTASLDEQITAQALIEYAPSVIVNVIDGCHLERHLYLTSQLLELGCPMVVVLTMMDVAANIGVKIDTETLTKRLGCPVNIILPNDKRAVDALKLTLTESERVEHYPLPMLLDEALLQVYQTATQTLPPLHETIPNHYVVARALEGDQKSRDLIAKANLNLGDDLMDTDLLMADARFEAIHQIAQVCWQSSKTENERLTARIDDVVLHRYLGLPIFFAVMYGMFYFAIGIGGYFQPFFDNASEAIFIEGAAFLLQAMHSPDWLVGVIAYGIGRGINTTLTFIPVLASMYLFLNVLEASGYMARAAFVIDRVMRCLGLPGKAFVPMIIGFGCNVPAIMAARTLDAEKDRLLTILMTPFMSCSARLAIYAVFVSIFFPANGQNVVFSLYLVGIVMAVFTGYLLRRTYFKGEPTPLLMELPLYHRPDVKRLYRDTWLRLRLFIIRAGRIIVPVCMVLGGLSVVGLSGVQADGIAHESLLSTLGRWITPLFSPMGIDASNWPATVALLMGLLAKEVVIGTLNSLYSEPQWVHHLVSGQAIFMHLKAAFATLWGAIPAERGLTDDVMGAMARQFHGAAGAYAYLLFVLLYIPCTSTMAVIRQEANRHLMLLSVGWSLLLAYSVSVLFYQLATIMVHPGLSMGWVVLMVGLVFVFKQYIQYAARSQGISSC